MLNPREERPDRQQVIKAYNGFFRTTEGRLILNDLEQYFGGSVATDNPHTTALRAGEQAVLIHIRERANMAHEILEKESPYGMV